MWEDLAAFTIIERILTTKMEQLRANQDHLRNPPSGFYERDYADADYTTTADPYKIVDETNTNIVLVTFGGPVRILLTCRLTHSSGNGWADLVIRVDGQSVDSTYAGNGHGWHGLRPDNGGNYILDRLIEMPAGVHDFRLIWSNPGGTGTLTMENDSNFQFEVTEE